MTPAAITTRLARSYDEAASDEGQLYNPAADATTAIPEHHGGDAIGNTTTGDPEISA